MGVQGCTHGIDSVLMNEAYPSLLSIPSTIAPRLAFCLGPIQATRLTDKTAWCSDNSTRSNAPSKLPRHEKIRSSRVISPGTVLMVIKFRLS